jgi:SAM-dependent methyltransferase
MEKFIMSKMEKNDKIKEVVKQKYGEIVLLDQKSCCSSSFCCSADGRSIMSEDYRTFDGYIADADMGLGCGLPTQFADIQEGDTVLDLGSGAGNDCFVARAEVGESGKVVGIDFTPEMVAKARDNAKKRGFQNVEFREGDIENLPVESNSIDVVISNCVLNLLPAKDRIFHEIYRVLKLGGHFCISDIVLKGELPRELSKAVEMYVGCVAGAIPEDDYITEISKAKFQEIEVVSRKKIEIPDEILLQYMDDDSLTAFKSGGSGIFSITVKAKKQQV